MLLKCAAVLLELLSTGSTGRNGRVLSPTSSSDSARHCAEVRVTLPAPPPPSPYNYSTGLTCDILPSEALGRTAATQNGPVRRDKHGLLRVSHFVEEFITFLVYFPHKSNSRRGASVYRATTVALTESVWGMSAAQGHRAPAQRGLVIPLVEKRNGRQS